ncbi:MAG: FAD-dependent oxidoreductase [Proteobacteria bacterium]|nr:FAD-dependent oxidoreductase [Pseudomonadota bacterium]
MSDQTRFDLIVVGTGAAGLSAALAASVAGARVLVIEKAAVLGGTTAMSGGCIWVPGHHHMAALGVSDSRDAALEYIRAVSPDGWHNSEEAMWAAFVDQAPAMLKFIEAHSPTRFIANRDPDPYAEAPGGMAFGRNVAAKPLRLAILGAWRDKIRTPTIAIPLSYEELVDTHFYANPKKWVLRYMPRLLWRKLRGARTRGNALTIGLLKGCLDHGVEIWSAAAAQRLIQANGRVTGLDLIRDGKTVTVTATKGVILASGGFEWNPEMMAEHFPGPVEWTGSPSTNTGDGQRMAAAVGAALDRMDQALIMGTAPVLYEGRIQGLPAADYFLPHSMIVNRHGRRFVNEKQMNVGLAFAEIDPQTGTPAHLPAWRIYDAQFAAKYPHALPKKSIPDNHFTAATLADLAARIDVDPAGLVATAQRFSTFARAGVDEDFARGATIWDRNRGGDPRHKPSPTLGTIEQPPFYAMPFKASFLTTKGGARTNTKAEVLDRDGAPIPGLYAAGNAAANAFGSKGVGAGTTLGPCLTWGYIAGLNAAAAKVGEIPPTP